MYFGSYRTVIEAEQAYDRGMTWCEEQGVYCPQAGTALHYIKTTNYPGDVDRLSAIATDNNMTLRARIKELRGYLEEW